MFGKSTRETIVVGWPFIIRCNIIVVARRIGADSGCRFLTSSGRPLHIGEHPDSQPRSHKWLTALGGMQIPKLIWLCPGHNIIRGEWKSRIPWHTYAKVRRPKNLHGAQDLANLVHHDGYHARSNHSRWGECKSRDNDSHNIIWGECKSQIP